MITVAQLIEHLKAFPQDIPVAYAIYSEYVLLDLEDIRVMNLQHARPDGWVHRERDDKPKMQYLVFPGN